MPKPETSTNYEPSAWMRAKVAELMKEAGPAIRGARGNDPFALIMIPLTHTEEGATKEEMDRWETSCDRCQKFCVPLVDDFHTGALTFDLQGGGKVNITFGLCQECKLLEVGGK